MLKNTEDLDKVKFQEVSNLNKFSNLNQNKLSQIYPDTLIHFEDSIPQKH